MKLIIGLGNPGPKYSQTRHNIGFMVVNALVEGLKAHWKEWGPGKNSEIIQTSLEGEKVILLKPHTFMNLSGQAVVAVAHFFKILPEEISVIHDDLDLPFGDVRLKIGGGDGGHNGLKSLTQSLSTPDYARIRMGIGRPAHPSIDSADFVLSVFKDDEWPIVEDMLARATQAISAFARGPEVFLREMNLLNRKQKRKE